MAASTTPIGKRYEPVTYAVGREKIREYASAVGESNPLHFDLEAARAAGHADVVAPPMFAVVYSARAVMPGIFDPEVGIDFARMLHAAQEFRWGPLVVAGDEITTTASVKDISERGGMAFYVFETVSENQRGELVCTGDVDADRERRLMALVTGETLELRVTPDRYVTVRYAGAIGRLQPDPHRRGVRPPGRPARTDPARAVDDGAGGPRPHRGGRRPRAPQAALGPVPRRGPAGGGDRGQRGRSSASRTALAQVSSNAVQGEATGSSATGRRRWRSRRRVDPSPQPP